MIKVLLKLEILKKIRIKKKKISSNEKNLKILEKTKNKKYLVEWKDEKKKCK
jgi:hypothetical protein